MRSVQILSLALLCAALADQLAFAEELGSGPPITQIQFLAPEPVPTLDPVASAPVTLFAEPAIGCGCGSGETSGCATGTCGTCCDSGGCGSCAGGACCRKPCAACLMSQHHAYFPPMHGYYYFRPYHHSHVRQQQALVGSWGGNIAHPYANEIFETVYQQYKAEQTSQREQPEAAQ